MNYTDFLWLNDQVLLTCSKDGKLIQQLFRDGQKPIDKAVSAKCVQYSLTINLCGFAIQYTYCCMCV